jgi:hypothetical protein
MYDYNLKLVYLMVYIMLHYLNLLKNLPTLTLYTMLNTLNLNSDHKMNTLNFI